LLIVKKYNSIGGMKMIPIQPIRPSPIAGSWYSSNANFLANQIDQFIESASFPKLEGEVIGVLAPHAGYQYSGSTAGYAFRTVVNKSFELVVILSPFHAFHSSSLLSSAHIKYATPLGNVSVAHELLKNLSEDLIQNDIQISLVANDKEHSLEIEIPFLQRTINGNFDILPFMVRHVEPVDARKIANILYALIKNKKVLIVISSDLSHFYSDKIAQNLDSEILSRIASYSMNDVYLTEVEGKGFACGLGAIMVGMELTRLFGGNEIKILSYKNSGEITGDLRSVVGYGAAAFLRKNLGN